MSLKNGMTCSGKTNAVYITGLGHEYPSHSIKQEHFMDLIERLHPDEIVSPTLVVLALPYDPSLSTSDTTEVSKNSGDSIVEPRSSLAQLPSTSRNGQKKMLCHQESILSPASFALPGYSLLPLRAKRLCEKPGSDPAI
jgi:hypothetical protein